MNGKQIRALLLSKKGLLSILILLCICAAVLVISILHTWQEYQKGDEIYQSIRSNAMHTISPPENPLEGETSPAEIRQFPQITLLQEQLPDCVAWVTIYNTPIDYPVMWREDDLSYYLNRTADGTENAAGSIFMDGRNSPDFQESNMVLYGHNMKNDTMFGSLKNYLSEEYWRSHPTFWLTTSQGTFQCEVFSAYQTTADSDSYIRSFSKEEVYAAFLKKILNQCAFDTAVPLSTADSIITLSTCTNGARLDRYVVHGKLTPWEG